MVHRLPKIWLLEHNGAFGRRCLGRILETHPGEDGIIRVVTVGTAVVAVGIVE